MPFVIPNHTNFRAAGQRQAYLKCQTSRPSSPPTSELKVHRELNEPVTGGARKRRSEGEDEEGGMAAKRLRDSKADEARLVKGGRQDTPSDAQPIGVPTTYFRDAMFAPEISAQRKPGGGQKFKLHNTLKEERHAPKANTRFSPRITQTSTRRFNPAPLDVFASQSRQGKNAQDGYDDDDFDRHDKRVHKRQKVSNGDATHASTYANTVDLTQDDSQNSLPGAGHGAFPFGNPIALKGQAQPLRGSGKLRSMPRKEQSLATFADRYNEKPPQPNKRKSRGSIGSSQTSTCASPNYTQSGTTQDHLTGPRKIEIHEVNDDPPQQSRSAMNGISNRGPISTHESERQLNSRRSSHDSDSPRARNLPWGNVGQIKHEAATARPDQQEAQPSARRRILQSTSNEQFTSLLQSAMPIQATGGENLRDQFVRDSQPESGATKPRASQRTMTLHSRNANTRLSTGSIDELHGATTIGTRTSRGPSPQKRAIETDAQQRQEQPPSNQLSKGISGRKTRLQAPNKQKLPSSETADGDCIRIPVDIIMCRGCCLQQEGIELVWDNDLRAFLVECNGERQRIFKKEQIVFIGKSEVRQWFSTGADGNLDVHIRGSITDNSNGHILIRFADKRGLDECDDILSSASKDTMSHSTISRKQMEGVFENVRHGIDHDHMKQLDKAAREEEMRLVRRRVDASHGRADSEERVIYDTEPLDPHTSRRSQMQGGGTKQRETDTESRYFSSLRNEPRRSTRAAKPRSPTPPKPVRWTEENKIEKWSHSVVYPPEGATRRITVDFQDLERLDEGELLNDNIISFALRQAEENMAPEHKDKVHFFNSFFYEALTRKNGKKGFFYEAVQRWTKNKDLFNIPYIVVPINIDLHWFVAIICNLNTLARTPAITIDDDEDNAEMLDNPTPGEGERGPTVADVEAMNLDTQESMEQLTISDHDVDDKGQARAAEEISRLTSSAASSGNKKSKKKAPPPPRKFDTNAPTIISLDSLGLAHSAETRNLKDYINAEAESKRGMAVASKDLQGMTAKGIPEQTNFCDCGVYLVGYIEEFVKEPKKFVNKVLQRELDKQSDFASFDPSAKRAEIRDQLLKLYAQQEAERKGKKKGTSPKRAVSKTDGQLPGGPNESSTPTATPISKSEAATTLTAVPASSAGTTNPGDFMQQMQDSANTPRKEQLQRGDDGDDLEMAVPRALNTTDSRPGSSQAARMDEDNTSFINDLAEHVVEIADSQGV